MRSSCRRTASASNPGGAMFRTYLVFSAGCKSFKRVSNPFHLALSTAFHCILSEGEGSGASGAAQQKRLRFNDFRSCKMKLNLLPFCISLALAQSVRSEERRVGKEC